MELNNEEALEFINCLLDRLHQAGFNANGSHLQLVYVAPGAQHINTQNVYNNARQEPVKAQATDGVAQELPDVLRTPEAMALWQKAQRAGYVDEHYQPLLSRTQAALLADAMAERLGIKEKWKVFETFWNRKNMYRDYYKSLNLQQSLAFQDEIKKLFR